MNSHSERDHALLSASSAHRWLTCPPSAVAAELYPDTETEFSKEGTLAHEVAEEVARLGGLNDPWKEGVTKEMLEHAKGYADYIQECKKTNKAYVLLERQVDYSKWAEGGFGTCDCIIIENRDLTIIDYKYGAGVKVSAVDNPQMKLYALGALNDYGYAFDIDTVHLSIYQPRMNNVSTFSLSVLELLTWANDVVVPTAKLAIKGEGEYCPGEHCKFCPHAGNCRAISNACIKTVKLANGDIAKVQALAPYEVAEILRQEPIISLWLKRVREQALASLMNGEEIPGYKVVAGRGSRAWSNEFAVADKLKQEGYQPEDYTEVKVLSPAAMEKSIGKKKAAELLEEFLEKKIGAPTVAPDTDSRPVYDLKASIKQDFED